MLISLVVVVLSLLVVHTTGVEVTDSSRLNGYYHMLMPMPHNRTQFVFFVDYSPILDRYLVIATAQPALWGTATLDVVNDTAVILTGDNGDQLPGIIQYQRDLPSICWPTSTDFTCWNRLLSNVTRIHVINM